MRGDPPRAARIDESQKVLLLEYPFNCAGDLGSCKKEEVKSFFSLLADGAIPHDESIQLSLINNDEGEVDLDMREKCGEEGFCKRTVCIIYSS